MRPGHLLPEAFFTGEVDAVAKGLLGGLLVREDVVLKITEVEAYGGPEDSASHCRFGHTPRNAPMWEGGGRAYVYRCYGIHWMLNVVTGLPGQGAAVLVRACEPLEGLERIQSRRGGAKGSALLAGPGRVAQALGLDGDWSGHLLHRPGGLELRRGPAPVRLVGGPRVGIAFATLQDQQAIRRWAIADTPWVSRPRGLEPLAT